MNIKSILRKITEFGIGLTAITLITLAGCGGGGESNTSYVTVSTFAGSGTNGIFDAVGLAAKFMAPAYITSDGTYLYVTDADANNIRKIDISTGAVTTFAGSLTGISGVSDSPARFNQPLGITNDGTYLYVVDYGNNNIRRIAISDGTVTTIAGSPTGTSGSTDATGTSSLFYFPKGITRIGNNLFVSDSDNCTIRKIDISSSPVTVSTLAGTPLNCGYANNAAHSSVQFYYPAGLTNDGASFIYVTDTLNNDIRKINAVTGETAAFAGGNSLQANSGAGSTDAIGISAGFKKPMGITTDGTNLYVTDTQNYTVRKIVISTKMVSTLAGVALASGKTDGISYTARFNVPTGIISVSGVLYIADTSNHTVRMIK
jgi:hypothetical protein